MHFHCPRPWLKEPQRVEEQMNGLRSITEWGCVHSTYAGRGGGGVWPLHTTLYMGGGGVRPLRMYISLRPE